MKKIWSILCVCTLIFLSGCGLDTSDMLTGSTFANRQIFKIEGMSCDAKEAEVYLANYRNIYGVAYGIDFREKEFKDASGKDSLEEYVKKIVLDELTRVYCMDLLAESREQQLSGEEAQQVREAAVEYYTTLTDADLAKLDVTVEDLEAYYGHYALAGKIYHYLTESVNGEVSDDEARIMELQQIFVSTKTRADEVRRKLLNGEDFASVANNYNELPTIQVTVSRTDLPDEVEEAAFSLDNDEISRMIQTTEGFWFVKCLNKYNKELTEANKSNIVEKREEDAFYDVYNELVGTFSSAINRKVWDEISFDGLNDVTTDSFFEIFNKHCGEI